MKKVFLTLTMLLFAFVGTMRADVVEIGSLDGAANNSYLPMNSLYNYSFSEQIYTAEEIGMAGTINELTMWLYGNANLYTMPFDIYMVEVDKDAIESTTDWVTVTAADKVYTGEVTVHNTDPEAYTFTLDTPFQYSGEGNLVIAFLNNTGQWKSGLNGKVFGANTDPKRAIYARRDNAPYDIADLPTATAITYERNVITLDITAGGGGEAATLTVYDGENTNGYVPVYGFYADAYLRSQYVIPAADLEEMTDGTINQLTYYLTAPAEAAWTGSFRVYMTEVADATISAFVDPDNATVVYDGLLDATGETMVVTLDATYEYNGGNLLIGFDEYETGNYKSATFAGTTVTGASVQGYSYTSVTAVSPTQRNFIPMTTFDYVTAGGTPTPPAPVVVDVITDPMDLNVGYRPIGYWMEPYTFKFYTEEAGTTATITSVINGNDAFMPVALETPATFCDTLGAEATVTTGTAAAGDITEEFAIDFNGRGLKAFQISGTAYEPVEGDVWELAKEVEVPFTGNAPQDIYKNYNIENSVEGAADMVYKVTFENEVMLTAGTNGANGVARIYAEDFGGQPGPMVDNHYQYSAGGGYPPYDGWFGYSYNGSNTWFGTQAGGGMIYGYKVPVEYLAGYGHCYLTQVEAAAREAYPYNLYVCRGGDTPADAELVYYQEMPEPATALYFFDMDVDAPFQIGEEENLWVMFYSESPYAAYCGKEPVDTENAKIWYTVNGTTWYPNTTYTPVIYLHLEYPNPEEERGSVVMNLADMSIKPFNGEGTLAEAKGEVKNMPVHRAMPVNNTREGYPMLYNEFIPAGTYYIAVASTDPGFDVYIETGDVPAPEQAVITYPEDGTANVPTSFLATWELPDYATEMQVLLGTQYPPQTILVDWTSELFSSYQVNGLEPSQSYFMQVNVRNSAGTAYGEINAFTTVIAPVEGFEVEVAELYPGDAAVFTWEGNRSFKGYNLYQDGVKVNETLITETTYTVEDLEYNMDGYYFNVTAVYDAGESEYSDDIIVYMTGNGTVSGHVYDTDANHPIANATIEFRGTDAYGVAQVIPATADANGAYEVEVLEGNFTPYLVMDGYYEISGEAQTIEYEGVYENVDIIAHEYYYPLSQIVATEQPDENNVLVEWSWTPAEYIVDFETGDLSQAEFTLPATYPWAITNTNAHEGTYAIKSTCEGIASGVSEISVTVDVPFDGKMGFWVKVSSEANYDKFHFFIDGVEKGAAISGVQAYAYKEFDVTEGTHTYKWQYAKDSSVNSNDDCAYVDDITLYRYEAPLPPVVGATEYNFDDNTMMGWTSLDADGDGNGWVSSSNPGIYHNAGVSLSGTGHNSSEAYVISGSYANQTGAALTPNNYLVSPTQIAAENGAQIQFWACAQDASYAAEHFGVAVSTTTATASAFTTIQEWTMTAKSMPAPVVENSRDIRGILQGAWYQFSVDLSAYAGQNIWVAIRHFNCTDMFILNVDDITLATGGSKGMRGDRSLANYILYRGNLYDSTVVTINNNIPSDVMSYVEEGWEDLPFGMYQWGIQAKYAGYAPTEATRSEVVIGEGATTNNYLPTYTFYNYSLTEQIYTAAEIGAAGTINSVSFFNTGDARTRNVAVYMANTTKNVFTDNYDWQAMTAADKVFEGDVTFASGDWTTITFNTPFEYNGSSNVILTVDDNSGSYQSGVPFKCDATTGQMALRIYQDASPYNPIAPSNYNGTTMSVRNQIKLDVDAGAVIPNDGLSEIIWSNVIEKDMDATLTFNITMTNGDTPAGATIAIEGPNTYNVTATGASTEIVVRKDQGYSITVTKAGYSTWTWQGDIEADATHEIELEEIIANVDGLYVSPTGWVMWDGIGGGVTPGPGPGPQGTLFEDDFEDGELANWTLIDADGDGDNWNAATPAAYGIGAAHSGTYCASSWSWNNYSMDPDQYMVSPLVEGAASIHYFVATNTAYPDHYAVCASSTGTNASDFTIVMEENAGTRAMSVGGVKSSTTQAGTRAMSDWIEKTVTLPAGTKYVAFRHFDSYDMNYLFIDDVTIEGASRAERAPIKYVVKLDGKYDGETTFNGFQHNVEDLEEGSTHVTAVRTVYLSGNSDWVEYEWTYTSCDHFTGVTNLAAEAQGNDVKLTWTMPEGGNPNPNPNPNPGTPETFTFDDGTMQGWTTIDANNDGFDWVLGSQIGGVYLVSGASLAGSGHNSSQDLVCSGSYSNATGAAITPNNYLVSPAKGQYTSISFFACGQDASYVAEHFGVAVSTGSNTNASDFTIVQEWTMTAKGQGAMSIGRDGEVRAQGSWHEYTVDLSSYAGQDIWVAIRHFNCSDMFILDVDDITFNASKGGRSVIYEPHFVTDPGAMSNGADASWIKGSQSTYGPGAQHTTGNIVADDFTLDAATTITEIEVYGYQTGSTTTSTFTGLYAVIYDGNPMNGGQIVWGDMNANIMTSTSFTNAYRGSDAASTGTTRPIMALTASNLNIQLAAGTYYLAWNMAGSGSSGPWAQPEAMPTIGNTGDGVQYLASSSAWQNLTDTGAGTQYGVAFKLVGEGGSGPTPGPAAEGVLGAMVFRDGEYVAFIEGNTASQYVVADAAGEDAEYGVRVVYDGEPDVTYYAMSCMETVDYTGNVVTCDPVTDLAVEPYTYNDQDGALITFTEPEGATSFKIYVDGELLGALAHQPIFIAFGDTPDGTYQIGIVAVYADCESDMATVDFVWTEIGENEIVTALYPNPTSGDITIKAAGMNHITVVNALGQVMYDADVDADEMQLNLGQYNNGLYMVRISTENGVSVQRVIVAK